MNAVTISIRVNGVQRDVTAGTRVQSLLRDLEFLGKRIAVERNGEIVPRSRYADVELEAGDRVEIVRAVGGG
ncbi:MAG TPA: sulfur carrier protein ThiS [Casimicrobiaceae bacterium]|nr:sulfur carrier protein ThiS [Casimicrobiaceae bacterium]